jgi:cytochrome bd ubiquinol oxidase subunit II
MTWLQVTWFLLVGVLLTAFAILDGFDLGVGMWHLGAKTDKERRTLLNAVGPVWDGNEVWLLTGGGALFAAFPPVYASVFSGFYIAIMLLLLALISRAVSLEFRSKEESPTWRATWDVVFSFSSILAALLFGVALGNVLRGIPLSEAGDYTGTFLQLLNPYALLIGLTGLAMIGFQGANFMVIKTENDLQARARRFATISGASFFALFLVAVIATVTTQPHLMENFSSMPILWIIPLLGFASIGAGLFFVKKEQAGKAFIASSMAVVSMMSLSGAGLFPRMVPALNDPALSLTISNSSSTERTLMTMLILTVIGVPIVLTYTIWVYKAFAGKVDPDHPSSHY